MSSFTNFPPCKHRFACLQCRNDKSFVENMQRRYGEWECPEGIEFGTPLEEMPQHIQQKIKTYQDRLKSKGKEVYQAPENPNPDGNWEKAEVERHGFTALPMCKHRAVCFDCRNNTGFRERMEQKYGPWECPEGIAVGTPLNQMPEAVVRNFEAKQNAASQRRNKIDSVKQDLKDLEEMIPPMARQKFENIKNFIFPGMKNYKQCVNYTGETKQVEQKCCGGKVKMVEGFVCKKHGDVTEKTCMRCGDHKIA
jgi:hypothetical protein